jgi:hypothetical protein
VGEGRRVTKRQVPLLTNAVHWVYGAAVGAAYGGLASRTRPGPLGGGAALGAGV